MSYDEIKKAELEAGPAILEKISYFSTVFYVASEESNFFVTIGSGTFIKFGDKKYILTASHVVDVLMRHELIGIAVGGNARFYQLEKKYLNFAQMKGDSYTEEGPDIGLVCLPSTYTGEIEALGKIFYEISEEKTLQQKYSNDIGFWAIAGWPEERIENHAGSTFSTKAVCQVNLCIAPETSGKESSLLHLKVPGSSQENGLNTHGGMSGGGCWHAILGISEDKYYLHNISLRGVVFYELLKIDSASTLVAHEKNSVYNFISEYGKA